MEVPAEDNLVEGSPGAEEARSSGEGVVRSFEAEVVRSLAAVGTRHGLVLERTTSSGAQVRPREASGASW